MSNGPKNKTKKTKKAKKSSLVETLPDHELKYHLYEASVQNPDYELDLVEQVYGTFHKGHKPHHIKEDFCGTHFMSCEWVKRNSRNHAWGLDISDEALEFGERMHAQKLSPEQRKRLHILKQNVLVPLKPSISANIDLIYAGNFSYFLFKERTLLKQYFLAAYKGLKPGGVFMIDMLGGDELFDKNRESTPQRKKGLGRFDYVWEQSSYNLITNEAMFYIHFKLKEPKKRWIKKAFEYDWRLWSVAELRDLLKECGFIGTQVFCEGDGPNGDGDSIFTPQENEKSSQSYLCILGSQKPK